EVARRDADPLLAPRPRGHARGDHGQPGDAQERAHREAEKPSIHPAYAGRARASEASKNVDHNQQQYGSFFPPTGDSPRREYKGARTWGESHSRLYRPARQTAWSRRDARGPCDARAP